MTVRDRLAEAAARRVDAATREAEALADIRRLLRSKATQGIPVAELARLTGLTRQSVYNMRA
jgi:DNA invertase Pin-like site-specific DNA recombinase